MRSLQTGSNKQTGARSNKRELLKACIIRCKIKTPVNISRLNSLGIMVLWFQGYGLFRLHLKPSRRLSPLRDNESICKFYIRFFFNVVNKCFKCFQIIFIFPHIIMMMMFAPNSLVCQKEGAQRRR